jgi:ribosome-associated protein
MIVEALEDKKGIDIKVLDVREIVSYTDFMVICTGTSAPHIHSLVSQLKETFRGKGGLVYVNPSKDDSWWILDFVDVVVHLFKEDARRYYDLEDLWCDAKVVLGS